MRFICALVLAALLAAAMASRANAASLPADTTAILSGDASLLSPLPAPVADSGAGSEAVSRNGRFVAFQSLSDGLSNEDDDSVENVYVKDMTSGSVTLVSRRTGAAGAAATSDCFGAAISADGTRVAFACTGSLDAADTSSALDVYVRDLTTNETILVSRQSAGDGGAVGDRDSAAPSLSEHGDLVAFVSDSDNLSRSTRRAVYVRDLAHNTTTLVSVANDGSLPDGDSFSPSISDAGDRVAFASDAGNLLPGDDNGASDVFVRSLRAGATELVSRQSNAAGGKGGNGFSDSPVISGNGEVVAFDSSSTNLDERDPLGDTDVYKHDLSSGTTTLVDTTPRAKLKDGAIDPTIDDHGNAIAFLSIGPPEQSTFGVTVQVAVDGALSLVHNGPPGRFFLGGPPGISGDGGHVVYRSGAEEIGIDAPGVPALEMRDLPGSLVRAVSRPGSGSFDNAGGESETPSVSADGRFVAFATSGPAFGVPPDAVEQIVVRDTATGAVTLASREDGPNGAPMAGSSDSPSISADGTHVAFRQVQPDGGELVWVRDLTTGRTVLVSRADGADGETANGRSFNPSIDSDGGRVAFQSTATNLAAADPTPDGDIYVRDLRTNQTILASVGVNGQKGNDESRRPSLSGDGRHVAFASFATNLGDGDTDPRSDIHVRDIDAGTTRLVSVSSTGDKGNQASEDPSIDADGSRVAFDSSAGNFGVTSNFANIWVRDLAAGTTTLASSADGANGAAGNDDSFAPALSPDGTVVAFQSNATNLTPDVTGGQEEVFRRDLAANTTRLASRASGANGAPVDDFAESAGISSQGACVVFEAGGGLPGPVAGADDFAQVYMRTFAPDCGRPGGGGTGTPPARDTIAPVLRSVSLSHTRFRVARAGTTVTARKQAPRGTVLSFTTSEPIRLTVVIERRHVRHRARSRRQRVSFLRVATLTRGGVPAGSGHLKLTGRIGKRRMAPGAYRLTLRAQDAAGNRSRPVRRGFTILPG